MTDLEYTTDLGIEAMLAAIGRKWVMTEVAMLAFASARAIV